MSKELTIFGQEIENVVSNAIGNISVHEWYEDHITLKMIGDIRKLLSRYEMQMRDSRRSISWELYKLSGGYENTFGDISFLVNLQYKDGTQLTGAAFLEAKKRSYTSLKFDAMNDIQTRRILSHAPRAQYLLYDHSSITDFVHSDSFLRDIEKYNVFTDFGAYTPRTNAVCCPMNLALSPGLTDTKLYRHGTPLSVMITRRYFHGLDLEFADEAIKTAGGYLEHHGRPKHVMKIDISELGEETKADSTDINLSQYDLFEID